MSRIIRVALVVPDYDEAVAFYVGKLGFTLVEDVYMADQDKRWVTILPPGAPKDSVTIVLARADNEQQQAAVGNQTGGRVFLFLGTGKLASLFFWVVALVCSLVGLSCPLSGKNHLEGLPIPFPTI